jgi:hypothetical protein
MNCMNCGRTRRGKKLARRRRRREVIEVNLELMERMKKSGVRPDAEHWQEASENRFDRR